MLYSFVFPKLQAMKTYLLAALIIVATLFNSCNDKKELDPDILQDVLNNIHSVVPEEAINNFRSQGMNMYIGGERINMRGIIYADIMEVTYAFDSKLTLGDKIEPYIFTVTRQDEFNGIRVLLGPHREGGHRMSGDGFVASTNGKNFTIFIKTDGQGPRGRSEYAKLWSISGVIEGTTILDLEYSYIVDSNEGVSFIDNWGAHVISDKREGRWSPSW